MTEPIRLDLDRHQFAEWLRGLPPHAMVGERRNCCRCPLAKFLTASGAASPRVEAPAYTDDDGGHETWLDLPEWAEAFVDAIDDPPTTSSPTARECLEVLEAVC
jgi:hypothetical protein